LFGQIMYLPCEIETANYSVSNFVIFD
jgi:hypothetical protein